MAPQTTFGSRVRPSSKPPKAFAWDLSPANKVKTRTGTMTMEVMEMAAWFCSNQLRRGEETISRLKDLFTSC